jgi:hypothetical protein
LSSPARGEKKRNISRRGPPDVDAREELDAMTGPSSNHAAAHAAPPSPDAALADADAAWALSYGTGSRSELRERYARDAAVTDDAALVAYETK